MNPFIRMRGLIKEIPLYVITNPEAGLMGAARYGVVHLLPVKSSNSR